MKVHERRRIESAVLDPRFPEQLLVSTDAVERWIKAGVRGVRLQAVRIGGRVYVTQRALTAFVKQLNDDDLDGPASGSSSAPAGPTLQSITGGRRPVSIDAKRFANYAADPGALRADLIVGMRRPAGAVRRQDADFRALEPGWQKCVGITGARWAKLWRRTGRGCAKRHDRLNQLVSYDRWRRRWFWRRMFCRRCGQ